MQAGAILKGTVLQGEYALLEPIRDEDGRLYRATQLRTHKPVVVRLWRGEAPIRQERFIEMLATASRIRHPALAALEAFGKQDDDTWFIVSELVHGEPLETWADKIGIPPLSTAVEILQRVCVGLNAAHRNGLAHDALNPRNVFVAEDDSSAPSRPSGKLLDLSVPAFMRPWPPRLSTAQFMAPEQLARALRADEAAFGADSRMNVYSCGSLLYYLCTGGAPVQGRNLEELALAHGSGKLVPPAKINPQISPALDEIIVRALSHAPDARFASVAELAAALARVRPARSASGVRPLAVPGSVQPSETRDRRATWDNGFDERPTSESRMPPVMPGEQLPVPNAQAAAPDAVETGPRAPTTARPPAPAAERSSAPLGSFSGPLPLRPPDSGPPPPSPPPPSPPPRPRRAAVEQPAQVPITVLLDQPAAIERAELAAIVPEDERTGSYLVAPYRVVSAQARSRSIMVPRWAWALALIACAPAAYFALRPAAVHTGAAPASERVGQRRVQAEPEPAAHEAVRSRAVDRPAAAPRPAALSPDAQQNQEPKPNAESELEPEQETVLNADNTEAKQARAARGRGWSAARSASHEGAVAAARPGSAQARTPALLIEEKQEPEPSASDSPNSAQARDGELAAADATLANPPDVRAASAAPGPAPSATSQSERAAAAARGAPPAPEHAPSEPNAAPLRLAAKARVRELDVHGSMATSEVRRAVARISSQFSECYARAAQAAGKNGFGELTVEVEIDERGRAHRPRAHGGALPGLDACVEGAAAKLSARPPDTGTVKASWKVLYVP